MKLSIVTPVLNSHEIVRRQVLHYKKMSLPSNVEIIFVDDGSDPALNRNDYDLENLTIIATHDTRPWTWALARNRGAKEAKGEYLLMCDLDYIIPLKAIEDALNLKEDRMNFQREFGVLDENGDLQNDFPTLLKYGLSPKRIADKGARVAAHTNDFVMRKEAYFKLNGYREDLIGRPYPAGEDGDFQRRWGKAQRAGIVNRTEYRPLVYMFPSGKFCGDCTDLDANPMELFHKLSRKNA